MNLRRRALTYWLCQTLGWVSYVIVGLAFFFVSVKTTTQQRIGIAAIYGFAAVSAIFTTHLYRSYLRRRGWLELPLRKALPRVLLASVVAGCTITALIAMAWAVILPGYFGSPRIWLAPAISGWSAAVFGWNVIYFGFFYYDHYRISQVERQRLETAAREAQLQALIAQVNPHFMFNCLNSLRALIVENPDRARAMVTELSELLRYSLQSGIKITVPLREELEMVATYLHLEKIRFEERLLTTINAAPETLAFPVPTMLVQALAENGVKHGIGKLPQGGRIEITARLHEGSLEIRVTNTGRLAENGNSTQLGLENSRERLKHIYGKAATLTLQNQGQNDVVAEISIPCDGEAGRG